MRKPTDWTGIKLHHLTFKKPSDKQTKDRIKWDLECDCGKVISAFPGNVRTGNNKSCDCMKQTTAKDWSGIKRDRLTFIRPTNRRYDDCIIWEALCDCYPCNMAKGDMTTEEFILHNERQYLHLTERREKLKQLKD